MANKTTKRVTTQDIAQRAGVTKATVSYVFNGTGSVSSEVREKILSIADELGYRPNRLAAATRTGKTHTVGLILPDLTNPFFPALAQAAQNAARKKGYSVFLVDTQNSLSVEKEGIERLQEYAVDGVMWCPIEDNSATSQKFDFPVVIIDRSIDGFDSVYADSYKGGKLQGEYLLQQGHRKIGIISGPDRSPSANARRRGLYSVIKNQCDILWDFPLEYLVEIPKNFQEKILSLPPTCVVTANDSLAIGLLHLYHKMGVNVPEDVSIIGFDDIDWADLVIPPLTTIRLPAGDIGSQAFDSLFNRLNNPEETVKDIILDVELIERASFTSK